MQLWAGFVLLRRDLSAAVAVACLLAAGWLRAAEEPAPAPEPLSEEQQLAILAGGTEQPEPALELLKNLGPMPSDAIYSALRELDRRAWAERSPQNRRLARQALLALGSSGHPASMAYLYQVFESAPDRRSDAAQAIARSVLSSRRRDVDDWQLLARSLTVIEGDAAREVLAALAGFRQLGTKPEWRRQVILLGLALDDEGKKTAVRLLEYWTGQKLGSADDPAGALAEWQTWFREKYPELPDPALPAEPADSKYKFAQLLEYLRSEKGEHGSGERGAQAFEKALCAKCHRYGGRGEVIGPDLSQVSRRFTDREILESIVFPSQQIPDQYTTKVLITTGGKQYTGMVGISATDFIVLQSNGEKVTVPRQEAEDLLPSNKSSMPTGLLNQLSLEEIADLFIYMRSPAAGY